MVVMCDFSAGLTCPRCGYLAKKEKTFRACQTLDEMAVHIADVISPPWIPVPDPKIGDRIAHALAYFGITKKLVSDAVGVKDCGCDKRQTGLNRAGGIAAKAVETVLDRAVSAVIGEREIEGAVEQVKAQLLAGTDLNEGIRHSASLTLPAQ